jgi:hypothetical protein
MQDGAGVGRRKTDARIPSVQRGLSAPAASPVLSGFDQLPANIHHRFLPFLTETGSQVECDVTHSKQTLEKILTGTRIVIKRSAFRSIFPSFSSEYFAASDHIPSHFRSGSSTTRHLHQKSICMPSRALYTHGNTAWSKKHGPLNSPGNTSSSANREQL